MSIDIGSEAPDFTLKNQFGEDITLSSFRGRKPVAIIFLPFAFSGVCTGELCEIRDRLSEIEGVEVLAITCDHFFSNRAWTEKEDYSFSVLSDFWPHGATASAYGVFDEKMGAATRGTYIVDTDGIVRWKVENAVPDAREFDAYREALAAL